MAWQFKREERQFPQIPEGRYRIRVKEADKAISKNGNDMLVLQFEVSGQSQVLYHYIVFLDDRPEITNRMLTQFFDSFAGIPEGDFNMRNWIGKVGACMVKHEDYNGSPRAKISYFISADRAQDIEPWREPPASGQMAGVRAQAKVDDDGFMKVDDADLPDFV